MRTCTRQVEDKREPRRGLALGYSFSFSFLSFLDTFEAKKTRHGPRARASRSTAPWAVCVYRFEIENSPVSGTPAPGLREPTTVSLSGPVRPPSHPLRPPSRAF